MNLVRQVAVFAGVGLAAAALDWGVLRGLDWAGVPVEAGRMASLALATVLTWQLNRRLTFSTQVPPSWGEFGRYTVAALAGVAINYLVFTGGLLAGLPLWAAFVAGTGVAAVFNFVRYRAVLS